MKRVVIEKNRARLYYDPDTRYLRLDCNGFGLAIELSDEERISLSKALWYCRA